MRLKWRITDANMNLKIGIIALFILCAVRTSDAVRRRPQRRSDVSRESPAPSEETLSELAEAMGAAGFESYTEGKVLVKRLIPQNSEPDLDVISHQGVIGKAGVDFPAFPSIPQTGFNCKDVPTGYYADLETDCQVFHICDQSRKISFLCPNGTIFSQSHLICDWWFKVDCASAPALYESSAEYYSNEQKKTKKITQTLSKNPDLQQIGSNTEHVRAEMPRRPDIVTPSPTERLLRHRQKLERVRSTVSAPQATSRAIQFEETNPPTQRTVPTGFEKRRNLVQLIGNNFNNNVRSTAPSYRDASTYRTTTPAPGDFNGLKEMQVAAESASFASNNNRQFYQDFNKNYRPYPVYTPNLPARSSKSKSPTLTTLFVHDIREQQPKTTEATTKRPTLVPYTKSYVNNDRREPYTRPGVSLLKSFLEKEKNKNVSATTERIVQATARADQYESRNAFETATKIPQTTRSDSYLTNTASSAKIDTFSTNTAEPDYQERRERLMRRLNLDQFLPTEPTFTESNTENQGPPRPGLIVPPSLTPKTLHSLAIYYATALDNLSTTQSADGDTNGESTTTAIDEYENIDDLGGLFSRHTINKYSKLFAQNNNADLLEEIKVDPNGTYNELTDDLAVQQSQNPIATSPQIRELAQVFTHALSAYLQDPVQFRKVLSNIRPTDPTFGEIVTTEESVFNTEPTTTINEEDHEILGFSDDIKARPALANLRDGKSLKPELSSNLVPLFPRIGETETGTPDVTEVSTEQYISQTTQRLPFQCCGRIQASYTTASTPSTLSTTSSYTNTVAQEVNTLANNFTDSVTTTERVNIVSRFGGFQNNTFNNSPYAAGIEGGKPLSENEYIENTNLPTAWGIDATSLPITNPQINAFESKKIRPTTYTPVTTPVYFTETDASIELENDEALQRAHSQSFVSPQTNNIQREGKTLPILNQAIRKPSEDLEAPTVSEIQTTAQTTTVPTTTKAEEIPTTSIPEVHIDFTSPDAEKSTDFQWSNNFANWQSTAVLDPITLNDGLSGTGPEQQSSAQSLTQTTGWDHTATTSTATEYSATSEQAFSSSQHVERTTPSSYEDNKRAGRLLKFPSSTEPNQDITTIAETVVEKAKEIMGEMNATTTEKLMNVMRKTKSKTVRRLILLLVQTCDDDHNSTAEASKKALLEALMAVSQKDMDEINKDEPVDYPTTDSDNEFKYTNTHRRMDSTTSQVTQTDTRTPKRGSQRSGKSLNFDPSAINSLTFSTTQPTTKLETIATTPTPAPFTRVVPTYRRGVKKFSTRVNPSEVKKLEPIAEARIAPSGPENKTASDTRAIELLRSLYTIAARWG